VIARLFTNGGKIPQEQRFQVQSLQWMSRGGRGAEAEVHHQFARFEHHRLQREPALVGLMQMVVNRLDVERHFCRGCGELFVALALLVDRQTRGAKMVGAGQNSLAGLASHDGLRGDLKHRSAVAVTNGQIHPSGGFDAT
jgi:hypothetical protein